MHLFVFYMWLGMCIFIVLFYQCFGSIFINIGYKILRTFDGNDVEDINVFRKNYKSLMENNITSKYLNKYEISWYLESLAM